jgi:hypothetical protein
MAPITLRFAKSLTSYLTCYTTGILQPAAAETLTHIDTNFATFRRWSIGILEGVFEHAQTTTHIGTNYEGACHYQDIPGIFFEVEI